MGTEQPERRPTVHGARGWGAMGPRYGDPHPHRIYDYLLGGKDNFGIDRAVAEKILRRYPDMTRLARLSRQFLGLAVRRVAENGVRQFIDMSEGLPAEPNVHDVARTVHPDARVVYVDSDPVLVAHNRALRATSPGVLALQHDPARPAEIMADSRLCEVIDVQQPVCVLFLSFLHNLAHVEALRLMSELRGLLAPDSHVVVCAMSGENMSRAAISQHAAIHPGYSTPTVFRTRVQVEELFTGYDLLAPGLAEMTEWCDEDEPTSQRVLCGIGRVRQR